MTWLSIVSWLVADSKVATATELSSTSRLQRKLGAVWERELVKDDIRSLRRATEDAVRHGDMVVDVEVEAAA